EQNDELGAPLIDEPAFDGNEPRLEQNEEGECDLDLRSLPMKCLLNIRNEEGPTILEVGDHHHADHADDELSPAKQVARASRAQLGERVHGASQPRAIWGARSSCFFAWQVCGMPAATTITAHQLILNPGSLGVGSWQPLSAAGACGGSAFVVYGIP